MSYLYTYTPLAKCVLCSKRLPPSGFEDNMVASKGHALSLLAGFFFFWGGLLTEGEKMPRPPTPPFAFVNGLKSNSLASVTHSVSLITFD